MRLDAGYVCEAAGRSHNEDNLVFKSHIGLFAVIDGMGGHKAGEYAALFLKDRIERKVRSVAIDGPEKIGRARLLKKSAETANKQMLQHSSRMDGKPMGCVASIVWVDEKIQQGSNAIVAHIGDTRVYLCDTSQLTQITQDHTLRAKIPGAPSNIVTRAIGIEPTIDIDIRPATIASGQLLILCSDGLTDYVSNSRIFTIVRGMLQAKNSAQDIAEALHREAMRSNTKDNVTVIIVKALE